MDLTQDLELLAHKLTQLSYCGFCLGCLANMDKNYFKEALDALVIKESRELRSQVVDLIACLDL